MSFENTSLTLFIKKIIKYNTIDEIINECVTQSIKGFVFERLYDIIIKFGFCDKFNNSKYIYK